MLEKIGCKLLKDDVVYCTIANLFKEYTIFKKMYNGSKLPNIRILKAKLLSNEQALALKSNNRTNEVLAVEGSANYLTNRHPSGRFRTYLQLDKNSGYISNSGPTNSN
jgi:hypothetical protein